MIYYGQSYRRGSTESQIWRLRQNRAQLSHMHWHIFEATEKCVKHSKKNTFPVWKAIAHQDRIQRGAQISMDEESERHSL